MTHDFKEPTLPSSRAYCSIPSVLKPCGFNMSNFRYYLWPSFRTISMPRLIACWKPCVMVIQRHAHPKTPKMTSSKNITSFIFGAISNWLIVPTSQVLGLQQINWNWNLVVLFFQSYNRADAPLPAPTTNAALERNTSAQPWTISSTGIWVMIVG